MDMLNTLIALGTTYGEDTTIAATRILELWIVPGAIPQTKTRDGNTAMWRSVNLMNHVNEVMRPDRTGQDRTGQDRLFPSEEGEQIK